MLPLTPRPHNPLVNHIRFVARDGLSLGMPFGQHADKLTAKAYRTLHSTLVESDERQPPKPDDPDFRERTRVYAFRGIEVEKQSGITTALYLEE
jgi:hypothetical protein